MRQITKGIQSRFIKEGMKQIILDTVSDLVANFLYYDRKEDEDLPVGAIENAIKNGDITVDEIVECFKNKIGAKI